MIIKRFFSLLMLSGVTVWCATEVYDGKNEDECTAQNEIFSCESSSVECHRLCKYKNYAGTCVFDCQPACICRQGFYRLGEDDRSKCVTKDKCPPEKKLPEKKQVKKKN